MTRTTFTIPDPLKKKLEKKSDRTGLSEAELIRNGLMAVLNQRGEKHCGI
ncbi:MAG: ribbon-helix-helix domain-containing protein [Candidatus Nanohaloarchaea archaeon]